MKKITIAIDGHNSLVCFYIVYTYKCTALFHRECGKRERAFKSFVYGKVKRVSYDRFPACGKKYRCTQKLKPVQFIHDHQILLGVFCKSDTGIYYDLIVLYTRLLCKGK